MICQVGKLHQPRSQSFITNRWKYDIAKLIKGAQGLIILGMLRNEVAFPLSHKFVVHGQKLKIMFHISADKPCQLIC
jgi:hypothetical protein